MKADQSEHSKPAHLKPYWPSIFAFWLVDTLALLAASVVSGVHFGLAYGVAAVIFGGLALAIYRLFLVCDD